MAFSQPFPLAATAQKVQQPTYGPDLAVRLICPECRDPNPNIVEEFGSGDLVCGGCGLVLGDRIVDTRSEWRVRLFPISRSFLFCGAAYDVFIIL
jgi:transcription initiation factor TFIIB